MDQDQSHNKEGEQALKSLCRRGHVACFLYLKLRNTPPRDFPASVYGGFDNHGHTLGHRVHCGNYEVEAIILAERAR